MFLVTMNMQGGNKWAEALGKAKLADFICVQECGRLPQGWKQVRRGNNLTAAIAKLGTKKRPNDFVVAHYTFGNTYQRCSLAVLGKQATGRYELIMHYKKGLRPLVGLEASGGTWVYSIHAPSGNHKAAAGVAKTLLGEIAHKRWVVAGDFNCPSEKMKSKSWVVVSSGKSTQQSGNELDFLVHSKKVKAAYKSTISVGSDHWGLVYEVV